MNNVFLRPVRTNLPPSLEIKLRQEISVRNQRARLFGTKTLRHPVWEILLHLTCSEFERTPISVSSLCNFIHCPKSTAIRSIHSLEKAEILRLQEDPGDGRRTFVFLAEETKRKILEHFSR